MLFNVMFSFSKTKEDLVMKWMLQMLYLMAPFCMVHLMNQRHIKNPVKHLWGSLLNLMHEIGRAHISTLATSLMHVKNNRHHFCLWLICWDMGLEKMIERSKASNWIVDHFSLIFVKSLLAWMLYFLYELE